jgi:hypothetical protein
MKMFFAPNGKAITSVSARSFSCPNVEIDEKAGTADLGHFDDFPGFERLEVPGLGGMLMDNESDEWLERHCRLIKVDDDFDVWAEDAAPPSWPEDIVDACRRVQWLGQTLITVELLRSWSPRDIREDPTINAALNNIVVGRVEAEMAGLLCRIDTYRQANPDITEWIPDEESEDVEA